MKPLNLAIDGKYLRIAMETPQRLANAMRDRPLVPVVSSTEEAETASLAWPEVPVRPLAYAIVALLAVAAQIAAFLYGFWELTGAEPTLADARLLASAGLVGCLIVLVLTVHLVREGTLALEAAVLFGGVGLISGLMFAFELPHMPGGMFGDLFLYGGLVLQYGAGAGVVCAIGALLARAKGKTWWPSLLAAPIWLETGAHASLLVGMLFQAEAVAEAAAIAFLL